ncbi:hypothetical protein [Streptomyces sp. F-1]|uniref:hypothetical protein n=1 Tax=Streptomyces sp. F-1 TaxID=463642 RepID=UPI000A4BF555|nr:hypothetical protein [Streptomyces sp. F-1]
MSETEVDVRASFLLVVVVLSVLLAGLGLSQLNWLPFPVRWPLISPVWWPLVLPVIVLVLRLCHGSSYRFRRRRVV